MPIEIPDDWPGRSWVEDTPIGRLETVSAVPETPAPEPRIWQVGSWETTREISASSLPGQVRHKTGLSIGTGKALVRREHDDYPWNRRDVFNLSGLHAQILLAPEGRATIPTGQFRVAPISGDMTTAGVQVDLDERQIEGSTKSANVIGSDWIAPFTQEDAENRVFDPSWLIQKLAVQMGYGVGMSPGSTFSDGSTYAPILDVPFQGALAPASPTDIDFSSGPAGTVELAWGTLDGSIALTLPSEANIESVVYLTGRAVVQSITITADVYGWLEFEWDAVASDARVHMGVQNRTGDTGEQTLEVVQYSTGTNGGGNVTTFSNYAAGEFDPERPYGIQAQVELIGSPVTSARTRVRRSGDAAWSAWFTHPMANTVTIADVNFDIELGLRRGDNDETPYLSRVTIVDNSVGNGSTPTMLWDNTSGEIGRIFLEPLFGESISTWLSPNLTVWGAMQEIVNAWQGALITDVYGNLRLMNRFTLSGVGTGPERTIDVGLSFEDIPWAVDYTDQADRLVVKYRPVVKKQWEGAPSLVDVLWEATDRIQVPGGGSRDVFFTLEYIDPIALDGVPFIRKDVDNGIYHVWDAYRYSNGTGTHITPGDMIAMRIDRVSSSTWKIHIKNLTSDPWFYMVDNTATPYLKIRGVWYYDQTAEQTVERGVSSGESTSALEIDLSNYVQTAEDANTIADFIWSRVNRRQWKAATISMVPDYRLDLGDVVSIRHERTRLRANALVTKVAMAGEPGSVSQKVDLVLIPPTWEDFDEAWGPEYHTSPPGSWAEFDALWDTHTWAEFDLAPTATTEQEIQEFI